MRNRRARSVPRRSNSIDLCTYSAQSINKCAVLKFKSACEPAVLIDPFLLVSRFRKQYDPFLLVSRFRKQYIYCDCRGGIHPLWNIYCNLFYRFIDFSCVVFLLLYFKCKSNKSKSYMYVCNSKFQDNECTKGLPKK